jgi:hypothetical protein
MSAAPSLSLFNPKGLVPKGKPPAETPAEAEDPTFTITNEEFVVVRVFRGLGLSLADALTRLSCPTS